MNAPGFDLASRPREWAVASTHAHRELVAEEHLKRQGFVVYCPQIRHQIRHARQSKIALRPLFPGYLFVKVVRTNWRPILSTLGVRSLIRSGEQLSLISDDFVEALRVRELDGAIHPPERIFRIGQQVRVASGPLDGLIATVIDMSEKDRICILMDLLKRSVKVHVNEDNLRAV